MCGHMDTSYQYINHYKSNIYIYISRVDTWNISYQLSYKSL